MRSSIKLFRIFGIDVQLHFSWWFVFALLAWSLSSSFFPHYFPDFDTRRYWVMGLVSAVLLFVSVLLHELSHSLVARTQKIKVESITLFFFGGVASISDEDIKPSSEFLMAIAGPLFSLSLAGIFLLIHKFNGNPFWTAITFYLYQLNFVLGLFNLVPGYPLDGGRAFRALLYGYYKDLKKATKIAVLGGRFFALFLILAGVLDLAKGSGGGLWFIFLGGFLYFIAGVSYEQVLLKDALNKIPIMDLLTKDYVKIEPSTRFSAFLEEHLDSDQDIFLVGNDHFAGILDLKRVESMPAKLQKSLMVKQVAVPLSEIDSLQKKDTAFSAYRKFSEQNLEILPVMEKEKLLGFVTRRKVMHRLVWSLKYGVSVDGKRRKK